MTELTKAEAQTIYAREIKSSDWGQWFAKALQDTLDNLIYRLEHSQTWEETVRLQAAAAAYREVHNLLE